MYTIDTFRPYDKFDTLTGYAVITDMDSQKAWVIEVSADDNAECEGWLTAYDIEKMLKEVDGMSHDVCFEPGIRESNRVVITLEEGYPAAWDEETGEAIGLAWYDKERIHDAMDWSNHGWFCDDDFERMMDDIAADIEERL